MHTTYTQAKQFGRTVNTHDWRLGRFCPSKTFIEWVCSVLLGSEDWPVHAVVGFVYTATCSPQTLQIPRGLCYCYKCISDRSAVLVWQWNHATGPLFTRCACSNTWRRKCVEWTSLVHFPIAFGVSNCFASAWNVCYIYLLFLPSLSSPPT